MVRTVTWITDTKLTCVPTANVILCLSTFTLPAQLFDVFTCTGSCSNEIAYSFTYDDLDLPTGYFDAYGALSGEEIKGAFCEDCLSNWIRELVDKSFELEVTRGATDVGGNLTILGSGPIEFVGGTGLQVTLTSPNIIKYDARSSGDAGNQIHLGTDSGLYVLPTNIYADGWVDVTAENWTYLSSQSVAVPTNATFRYSVGDKIKLVQGGLAEFFYVKAVAATVLTLEAGSSFFVLNQPIQGAYVSRSLTPVGFPTSFPFATTLVGFSASPTLITRLSMLGRKVTVNVTTSVAGTSNSTLFTLTTPIPSESGGPKFIKGGNQGTDNGTYAPNVLAELAAGDNVIHLTLGGGTSPWTASGVKSASFSLDYFA